MPIPALVDFAAIDTADAAPHTIVSVIPRPV